MSSLRLSDYDYALPPENIAQVPSPVREQARLMVVNRGNRKRLHHHFHEIPDLLHPGDVLILNDTRVFRARLWARKQTGGRIEVFLLRDLGENRWEALIRGQVSRGAGIVLEHGVKGEVEEILPEGKRVVRFQMEEDIYEYTRRFGLVPLPPYIRRNGGQDYTHLDRERYQTVYAKNQGSVAAPTAGLHFTEELLSRISERGVRIEFITLHVGYGTFKPVTAEEIREHKMDAEFYHVGERTAQTVNEALEQGKRVIAVGSTSTRALESAVDERGKVRSFSENTSLFIYPGYRFRVVHGLITNFHLPRSTLLMLVAAFAGKELVDQAYQEAMEMGYRFYSYGDAMLIV